MKLLKNPWVRLLLLLVVIASLLYLPTREFLKVTGILGVPFVFIIGFMHKQVQRSLKWTIAAICLIAIGGTYIYTIAHLPDRIEVRRIIMTANVLTQEGKYDSAIAEYSKLEELGKADKMQSEIEEVEREKRGQRDLQLAQQLIKKGDTAEARKLLEAIPEKTRAAGEAAKLLETISKD